MKYSFIIPVYNRPDEVRELLQSLCSQTVHDFEVVVVEDGSEITCAEVCGEFTKRLQLRYYIKPNSGPGMTRNYGAERANGEWLIILDSDCVLPPEYLAEVERELVNDDADAFGGPDRSHPDFTPMQKAISYAMTSLFTTGGIRGGKRKVSRFYPRSFNMGVRRNVYKRLGGFSNMRFGEDIDFSLRIVSAGYRSRLFADAWVWHKRRTDLCKFFKQVHNSGIARINLHYRHPGSLRLVYMLPAVAVIVGVMLLLCGMLCPWLYTCFIVWALLIFVDSSARNKSVWIGVLSVAASVVQIVGYGTGFLRAVWARMIMRRDEFHAFKTNFYK